MTSERKTDIDNICARNNKHSRHSRLIYLYSLDEDLTRIERIRDEKDFTNYFHRGNEI